MITAERLRELLSYDPETGEFRWRQTRNNRSKAGDTVGCIQRGYLVIHVDYRMYRAHRLAWLYVHGVFPDGLLDHIDGCASNNRIGNLRICTDAENMQNSWAWHGTGKSRYAGARWHKGHGKWYSQIKVASKRIYLGTFNTEIEAHEAYVAAKKKYHPFHPAVPMPEELRS